MSEIMNDNINIKVFKIIKEKAKEICKRDKTTISDVLRDYITQIVNNNSTKINVNNTNKSNENDNLKFIIKNFQEDNKSIIKLLKSQLEEKDIQLKNKDKLIENMQVLLKEEQSKNVLLLGNKNNTNKISWFPFFKNKNV